MIESYRFSAKNIFYFDSENKCLARFPSNSNLKEHGSDNSLYFGMTNNDDVVKILKNFFEVKHLGDVNGKTYTMNCNGDSVDVELNINNDGQFQVKICKNGTMFRLAKDYSFRTYTEIDFTKWLIVVDFKNREIRFRNPDDFLL